MSVASVLAAMRALPLRGLDAISGDVLILAPHPDDESLGCGGLIAACCDAGRTPFVLVLTDGAGSHPNSLSYPPAILAATRAAEARAAVAALGLPPERIGFLGLADTRAPHDGAGFDRAVRDIVDCAALAGCTTLAAPWEHDPHCDHLAAHRMAAAAARVGGLRHIAYPVWGWTLPGADPLDDVVSGFRLDITPYLPAKRRAIAAHASQHGRLITDDPAAFVLPSELLSVFDAPFEVFLETAPSCQPSLRLIHPWKHCRGWPSAGHDDERVERLV